MGLSSGFLLVLMWVPISVVDSADGFTQRFPIPRLPSFTEVLWGELPRALIYTWRGSEST